MDRVLARMQTKLTAKPIKQRAATKINGMKISKRLSKSEALAICSTEYSCWGMMPP